MEDSNIRLDVRNLLNRAAEIRLIRNEDKLYAILGELIGVS